MAALSTSYFVGDRSIYGTISGEVFGTKAYSSVKYTGSPIASRFATTAGNQQLITLTDKEGKTVQTNSLTITAGTADLYISVIGLNENVATYVWTNESVYFVEAGTYFSEGIKNNKIF